MELLLIPPLPSLIDVSTNIPLNEAFIHAFEEGQKGPLPDAAHDWDDAATHTLPAPLLPLLPTLVGLLLLPPAASTRTATGAPAHPLQFPSYTHIIPAAQ